MRRVSVLMIILLLVPQLFALDVVVTKNHQKYYGKVVGRKGNGFLLRTREGSVVVIPNSNILNITQGNKLYDFETGMKYHVETKRPFLPLAVLGIASGVASVDQFKKYQNEKKKEDAWKKEHKENNDNIQPGKPLAISVVTGLLSIGSFYVAVRPLEVKVPLGKIQISAAPNQVQVVLHF